MQRHESWDEYFVERIDQGLQGIGPLTELERDILLTEVDSLETLEGFSPEMAQSLNEKGVRALSIAYKQDTAGKNKKAGLEWNEFNELLYKHSQCVISGVVQNWYLTEGRPLEKKVMSLFGKPDW